MKWWLFLAIFLMFTPALSLTYSSVGDYYTIGDTKLTLEKNTYQCLQNCNALIKVEGKDIDYRKFTTDDEKLTYKVENNEIRVNYKRDLSQIKVIGQNGIEQEIMIPDYDWVLFYDGVMLENWEWLYADWNYRIPFNISSTGIETNYQVKLEIDSVDVNETHFNFTTIEDELRIANETNEMNFWIIGADSDNLTLWVKVNLSSGNNTFYLYYGNDEATSISSFDDTMTLDHAITGIKRYFKMNEGTGTVLNDNEGYNNSAIVGSLDWVSPDGSSYRNMNGTTFSTGYYLRSNNINGEYVDLGTLDELDGDNSFSLGGWIYLDTYSTGADITFFRRRTDNLILKVYQQGTNKIQTTIKTNTGDKNCDVNNADTYLTLDRWHLAMLVYNGSKVQVWVNNAKIGECNADGTLLASAESCAIGQNIGFNAGILGNIDNFYIFTKALNQNEMTAIYERRKYSTIMTNVFFGAEEEIPAPPPPVIEILRRLIVFPFRELVNP